jgi:hypothetical protein
MLIVMLAIASCMETPPPIDYGDSNVNFLNDTSYTKLESEIPDPDSLVVSIDDLTGIRCVNCPEVAARAKAVESMYPGRVVVKSLYPQSPSNLTTPYNKANGGGPYEDLRTEAAQLIAANIIDYTNQLPGLSIQRDLHGTETVINIFNRPWESYVTPLISQLSKCNLSISTNQTSDSTVELQTSIVFQESMSEDVYISISLLENDLKQPQSDLSTSGTDYDYKHSHVLRKMYTQYNGALLVQSAQTERGLTIEKGYELVIPSNVNIDNADIVVELVYNSPSNHSIIQCQKKSLK